jgi:FemAB-related protein (PEP-CTERM system-associated)
MHIDLMSLPVATIRALEDSEHSRWDSFVEAHPQGTVFHLSGWRSVLTRATPHAPHYLVAERNGEIVGVLPLAHMRSMLFGSALVSTPFCVYGGILAADAAAQAALERAAIDLGERLGVPHIEMRNTQALHAGWPTKDLYVTFRRELSADVDANMNAIPRKQRAMIRKAQQFGLTSHRADDVEQLYDLYSESVHNLGTPVFSRRYLRTLREVFAKRCEVTIVTHQSSAVAGVLSFRFRDEVHPYYGGGTSAARGLHANDFLYWEVMARATADGVRIFDYGRSKRDSGSYRFKKHWGFEETPLPYQYHLYGSQAMPDRNPNNPKYQLLVSTWKRLPLSVSRVIGPMVAPHFS